MRYRRLGATELMVSEVGLDARALLGSDAATAEATLRAAIALGVTVVAWDVSDALEDVEPLIASGAGTDRGRLTLVATLDYVPAAEDLGPQVEAIASRLGSTVDVVAFPGALDASQAAAFEAAREQGTVRFAAKASPGRIDAGGGLILPVETLSDAAWALATGEAACVVAPVAAPGDLRVLVASAS